MAKLRANVADIPDYGAIRIPGMKPLTAKQQAAQEKKWKQDKDVQEAEEREYQAQRILSMLNAVQDHPLIKQVYKLQRATTPEEKFITIAFEQLIASGSASSAPELVDKAIQLGKEMAKRLPK